MSTSPTKKCQEDGGPALKRIAKILRENGTSDSAEALLRALTLNVLIGNGDAHGKNFSLLHLPSGALALAPLYDVMSTFFCGDDRLAMYVDNVHRTDLVAADGIVNEAASWGLSKGRAADVVADILERSPEAIAAAQGETDILPPEIPALVEVQLARLWTAFDAP